MKPVKNENIGYFFFLVIMAVLGCIVFFSKGNATSSNSSYVKPYHTKTGKLVKGHVRKSVSTDPNAFKKRNYSKGYYDRNKFRYRKTKEEEK